MSSLLGNRRFIIIIVLLVAFIGTFYSHKARGRIRNYADFHCFYTTGQRILNHENIYVVKDPKVAEFRYAPIFAVAMSALALLSEDTADTIWYSLNFILLILSFILLKKLVIPEDIGFKPGLIIYLMVILGSMRLILHNLSTGQTNILMMFVMLLGLYHINNRREALGGAILALAITIKYIPLAFLPYFIMRRKFKAAAAILAALGVYIILPGLLIGMQANFLYIKNLFTFLTKSTIFDEVTLLDPANQSLLSAIRRLFFNCGAIWHAPKMPFQNLNIGPFLPNLITLVTGVLMYLSILLNPRKGNSSLNSNRYLNIDYALIFICIILFNMNSWPGNYILLCPAYFIIAHLLVKGQFKDKRMLTLFIVSCLLNLLTLKSVFGKIFTYKAHFYSPSTISALLIFGALLSLKYPKKSPEIGDNPKPS